MENKLRLLREGDPKAILEALSAVAKYPDHDALWAEKPWVAEALEALPAQKVIWTLGPEKKKIAGWLHEYFGFMNQALTRIAASGVFKASLLNIRTEHDGYNWGPSAKYSYILERLGARRAEALKKLKIGGSAKIAERWFVTDDVKYPSWTIMDLGKNKIAVPLFWLLRAYPELALGKDHATAFGPSLGMMMKYLDVAEALSWQVHLGLTEGYVTERAQKGSGIFWGVRAEKNPQKFEKAREQVRKMLQQKNKKAVRWPAGKTETEFKTAGNVSGLLAKIDSFKTLEQVTEFLLVDGRNVVDLAGLDLLQSIPTAPGERLVTREAVPHAFYGLGDKAASVFLEFKASSTGNPEKRKSSAEQTWALADNLLGRVPRPGKVSREKLMEALRAIKKYGYWRAIEPADISHHGDAAEKMAAPGVKTLLLHREPQYSSRRITIKPGAKIFMKRYGQHSAIVVRRGVLSVQTVNGSELAQIGKEEEALVLANQGDLIFSCAGKEETEVIDFKRPVPGAKLPEPAAKL